MVYGSYAQGLPDAATQGEFYRDVALKRFLAWVIDVIFVSLITGLIVVFTAFIGLFFVAAIFATVDFLYRWISLSRSSATPGMRLAAIGMRNFRGERFDVLTAFWHTLGYFVSWSFGLPQLISVFTIMLSPRRQSLTDMVLGTAAVNRRAFG